MTYVGATPTTGDFKKLDSITTSSATTFNLRQGGVAVYPQSANHCIVSLNGVIQAPVDAFTIVNDTIVFASSLASSDVINFILVLGNVNDIGTVSDDTVSTAKLQANSVTAAKFNADVISGQTALAVAPADTDEFLVSDGGVIKRIDYSLIKAVGNAPYFAAFADGSQTISTATTTKLTGIDTELIDSGGTYNTSTCEWSPGSAGTYFVGAKIYLAHGGTSTTQASIRINLSSSAAIMKTTVNMGTTEGHFSVGGLYYHASAPTFSVYVRHNAGGDENVYGATGGGGTGGFHEAPALFWGFKVA